MKYNHTILEQSPGQTISITAIDSTPTDITSNMQKQILIAARKKDLNSTGNLPYELIIKINQLYDLTANVAVDNGMVNGAECYVRVVENNPLNPDFPKCIWVEFIDRQIGQNIHRSCSNQYSLKISKTWTPIYSIRRSFTVKCDQKVTRIQFPLQLGSARTIHKAQSSTYQEIVVDMSTQKKPPKHFWEHMHYVAFSRCTSLDGLHIVDINEKNICQSEKVKLYLLENKRNMELCYVPSYKMENYLKISYNNICSFMKKKKAIMNNCHLLSCDIIILAETWLSTKINRDLLEISNFHLNRMDSTIVTSHRGLIAYTTNNNNNIYSIKMTQTLCLEICECDILNTNQLIHMSQRMTFLHSLRLGNRSSWLVTKPTASISKAWQPGGMPNLDRTIAPLRMRVDTVPYLHTCAVSPPEMTLYKEAYWPQAVSQSLAVGQP